MSVTTTVITKSHINFSNKNSGDCQLENSTVKLLNTLEANTRANFSKIEKYRKGELDKNDEYEYEKARQLLTYEEAPRHLQFNPFIRRGYRTYLSTKMCLKSMFWWTNETVNIWSHVFGWFLFLALTINDIQFLKVQSASWTDTFMFGVILICFQVCMILSSIYHTFSCRSEKDYDCFLSYDLFGIALSLLAIYVSGIYYAFWCHDTLRTFYITTVGAIFAIAMGMQIPKLNISSDVKMIVFVSWAAYGILPTVHWAIEMGGFQNSMVSSLVPRVVVMYIIFSTAFLIYIAKIPERWLTGKVDFFGHSHNWWHFFVLVGLYYWHNTSMLYLDFRVNHGCSANMVII